MAGAYGPESSCISHRLKKPRSAATLLESMGISSSVNRHRVRSMVANTALSNPVSISAAGRREQLLFVALREGEHVGEIAGFRPVE